MYCTKCHDLLADDASFCSNCGAQVEPAVTGATQRLTPPTGHTCPKCGSAMERGFIPDEYRDRNEVTVWVQGRPERDPLTHAVDLRTSRMWQVLTYRCRGCGYLESYANDEITPVE